MRLLPLLLCLPLLAACQKRDAAAEAPVEAVAERMAGRDVAVSQKNDRVTIKAKDAQLEIARDGEALPLPADFPKTCSFPRASSCATARRCHAC